MNPVLSNIRLFLPALAAAGLAAAIYLAVDGLLKRLQSGSVLDRFYQQTPEEARITRMGSRNYRVQAAFAAYGLHVAGREQSALYAAYGLLSVMLVFVMMAVYLPPLIWLGAPLLAYLTVNGLITARWEGIRLEMENEIPTMLRNIASTVQATPNVLQTLSDVSASLSEGKPLRAWMQRFVQQLQQYGQRGLEDMQQEAEGISPALLLVVVEIGRLWETGGSGYGRAFRLAADNLSRILRTRTQAQAKAAGAWGTVRVVVMALGGSIVYAFSNPNLGIMHTPAAQVVLLGVIGWAALGWWYIQSAIRNAVE